tara:strand:- start:921 stop:1040 length:120 start_codon:yes stop_codon:yes gene_type:complete
VKFTKDVNESALIRLGAACSAGVTVPNPFQQQLVPLTVL